MRCAPKTKITYFELTEELKDQFILFILEVGKLAGITDNEKEDVPMIAETIGAQCTDEDSRTTFDIVAKPSTCFNINKARFLIGASPFEGVSQEAVTTVLMTPLLLTFSLFPSGWAAWQDQIVRLLEKEILRALYSR